MIKKTTDRAEVKSLDLQTSFLDGSLYNKCFPNKSKLINVANIPLSQVLIIHFYPVHNLGSKDIAHQLQRIVPQHRPENLHKELQDLKAKICLIGR